MKQKIIELIIEWWASVEAFSKTVDSFHGQT